MTPPAEIVLYNPRSATGKHRVPMSLLALGSMLEGQMDYHIIDGNFLHDPVRKLGDCLEATGAQVLAMTVMPGPQLHEAIPLARALKSRFPQVKLIWGGYFPSNHPDVVLRSGYVDYVIRGTAEHEFRQFARDYRDAEAVQRIAGLSYCDGDRVVHNPLRPKLPELDALPPWPYHRLGDIGKYLGRTVLGRRTMIMHTSYGCPFTCSFCAVVPIFNGGWVGKSAALVADDVARVQRDFGVDAIEFADNNFFTSVKRVAAFCNELLHRELRVAWWGEGRPDTLDKYPEAVLAAMRQAGCRMIFLGAESGSPLRLQQMNKGGTQTPETILRLAAKLQRHDIIPEFSFVLGAPAEDVDAALEEELAFIRRVKQINPASEIIIYVYSPVPLYGSSLFSRVEQSGFAFPETLDGWLAPEWRRHDLRKQPRAPWLTPRHLRKIHDFEAVLNARYPTVSDIKLRRWQRALLRGSGALRYAAGWYRAPYEIKALQRLFRYRQPEIQGFEIAG